MKLSMKSLLNAVLLTTLAVPALTLSAVAQQEVDPTYYDPWASAPTVKVVAYANAKPAETAKAKKATTESATKMKNRKQTGTEAALRSDRATTIASAQPMK